MANILIVRSAKIGDVLIAFPIIYDIASKNKQDTFYVLTAPMFAYLFKQMPSNVKLIPMVFRKKTGMFRGLVYLWRRNRLLKDLKTNYSFDKIALLRADTFDKKIARAYFKRALVECIDPVYFYSKERVNSINAKKDGLTLSGLYTGVFERLGYNNITPNFDATYFKEKDITSYYSSLNIEKDAITILIAPFSGMQMKVYPLERVKSIIAYYKENNPDLRILILGGGDNERLLSEGLEKEFSNVRSLVGKFEMEVELCIIAQCKVLLTMDSANLHLGALVDIPIVSIWGPNDPSLGFYPASLPLSNAIYKNLPCRPCSVFGEYPCSRENKMECMEIEPHIVIEKLNEFI